MQNFTSVMLQQEYREMQAPRRNGRELSGAVGRYQEASVRFGNGRA